MISNAVKPARRSWDEVREHYEIEKELANRLRAASAAERRKMYGSLYDELYRRVTHHPLLKRKNDSVRTGEISEGVRHQVGLLKRFVGGDTVFMEVGAGSCLLALEVAKTARKVIAVDVSAEMTRRDVFPDNFELRIHDGCEVPGSEGEVDIAYSHQVMEHVHPEDAVEQLKSVLRVLKKGGGYLCVVPNRLNGPHDISRYFDKEATGFHMKEYTTGELKRLFLSMGYSRVSSWVGAKGYYFQIPSLALEAMEWVLGILPYGLRVGLGRRFPFKSLLEIRMMGWK